MLITACVLILLYTINSAISIPTVCFVIAWIAAALQLIDLGLGIGKKFK